MRRLALALFLFVPVLGHAQQGAAGYGQGGGGFGGGIGGGMGGFAGADLASPSDANRARPEDDGRPWVTRTAIVTPGEKVEYKFEAKKGETLFAGATSDAFDPALAVVDSKGREIAKNDDREEGDQSPFLAVPFPEDGTYVLRVLGYKSASGGKFTLNTLTFRALDAALGSATVEVPSGRNDGTPVFLRLAAKKGTVYDLRQALGLGAATRAQLSVRRIVGPTGVGTRDLQTIPMPDGTVVFRALADGDYYLDYMAFDARRIATDFREVAVVATTTAGKASLELAPGEAKVVEFPIEAGALVRTTIEGRNLLSRISAPPGPPTNVVGSPDPTYGNTPYWAFFLLDRDTQNDAVRIFHGSGTVCVAVRSSDAKPQTATVGNSESLPTWEAGAATKGTLGIGEIRLFRMRASKSELMKVYAKAASFQVRLDLFDLEGRLQNTLLDRKSHVAADDLYFPNEGTFLVRLSCDGYGGSGEYTMRREIPATEAYRLGETRTLTLDGSNFGLYAVDLEAGKRYELVTDAPDKFLRADLLDEDGQFLVSQAVRLEGVIVQYFVPTRSGRHRLWLRGEAATHRLTFRPNVPPKIGGTPE